jgi:hypothetical protein
MTKKGEILSCLLYFLFEPHFKVSLKKDLFSLDRCLCQVSKILIDQTLLYTPWN